MRARHDAIALDLIDRLWITDITKHPTVEGKLYCTVVLDIPSRRQVGCGLAGVWRSSPASHPQERSSTPTAGCDSAPWAFTDRTKAGGLVPSLGSIGNCRDNSMTESFRSRMRVELFDRRRWKTRLEVANAIFVYLEVRRTGNGGTARLGMLAGARVDLGLADPLAHRLGRADAQLLAPPSASPPTR